MTKKDIPKPEKEERPASDLDDSELLKRLFPKPVRRLVKGKNPDTLDDDDEPDDD
ncbi:MAG: hypothetical protein ACT4OP_08815 [Actinomycetota bacterium]